MSRHAIRSCPETADLVRDDGGRSVGAPVPEPSAPAALPETDARSREVAILGVRLLQRAEHLGDRRIVAHARGAVQVAERAIAVDDRDTGQPPPVTGDAPLTTAPLECAHVPRDHARPQPFRRSDAPDADGAIEVRVRVDDTVEWHAVAHEVLGLVRRTGSDGEHGCTRCRNFGIRLAHLREVVEAGDSAVIANRNDHQRAFEEGTELDR